MWQRTGQPAREAVMYFAQNQLLNMYWCFHSKRAEKQPKNPQKFQELAQTKSNRLHENVQTLDKNICRIKQLNT